MTREDSLTSLKNFRSWRVRGLGADASLQPTMTQSGHHSAQNFAPRCRVPRSLVANAYSELAGVDQQLA
jgi:hypothetical protein